METSSFPVKIFDKDKIPLHFHERNILKKLDENGAEQSLARYKIILKPFYSTALPIHLV
jgi:hypothetical protein